VSALATKAKLEVPIAVAVARALVERMESGEFSVGQKLPSESVLAKAFGISRPSVREALSALQFAGYVESRQGFGSVVQGAKLGSTASSLPNASADPVEVLQARLALEPEAVRLAAITPSPKKLRLARKMLDGMWLAVAAAGDLPVDSDIGLHLAIVDMCPNRFVRDVAAQLLRITNPPQWRGARVSNWSNARLIESWAIEHEAVLSAIAARQPERAARCARRHLYSTIEHIASSREVPEADKLRLQMLLQAELHNGAPEISSEVARKRAADIVAKQSGTQPSRGR
jgi:DNA-binding FadR family transcriptional regulator